MKQHQHFVELTHRKSGNPVFICTDAIVTIKAIFGGNKRAEAHGTLIEFFGSTLEVTESYEDVKQCIVGLDDDQIVEGVSETT
jgi:hypothetical protein